MRRFLGWLTGSLGIRAGEGMPVAGVATFFATIEVGRGLGEVGVDTLVVTRFGREALGDILPFLFIALGGLGLAVSLAYGAALGRVPRERLFVAILVGVGVVIVGLRFGLVGGGLPVIGALWLVVLAAGMLAVTMSWTVAAAAFDARQAKRLFPLLTGAAIAGYFLGNLGAGPVTAIAGAEALVLLEAVLFVVAAAILTRLPRRPPPRRRTVAEPPGSMTGELRAGFDFVARSPLMRLVAVAYVLLAVLAFSVQYPFLLAAAEAFPGDVQVATVLGLLSAAVTATSFVVSLTFANRLYARLGVTAGALLLPVVYLGGFGLWLVHFSFPTAAVVRFAQQVTQRGISNAAWSAFYATVPAARRAQVMAFHDGVPAQLGTIVSGLMLLAAGRLLAPDQLFLIGAVTAVVATAVVLGIRRRYADSLLAALRAGEAERVLEGGPGLDALRRDPAVGRALIDGLAAPQPGARELAATLLGRAAVTEAGPALVERTGDDDPRVRAAAIRALAEIRRRSADGNLLSDVDLGRFRNDPDPVVRAAAIVAGADVTDGSDGTGANGLLPDDPLLSDPSPHVRAAALRAMAGADDPAGRTVLHVALQDESALVREAAASVLAATSTDGAAVLEVARNAGRPGQRAALAALTGIAERDPAIRDAVAAWATERLQRAGRLRDDVASLRRPAREAHASAPGPLALLVDILDDRRSAAEESALGALAVLGTPAAAGVIRRCLHSPDVEIRAQALEALDSIGDRRVASALVPLLEDEPVRPGRPGPAGSSGESPEVLLARMADDADPWIRTLARRAIDDQAGGAMATAGRSLTDLDTMLLLHGVSLFSGLDPEDLQRVAHVSVERRYDAGDVLMREGEVGDELVVIVSGTVRVVRIDGQGAERLIRRYDAGEHIGELAVLRDRPRAATVIADTEVHGIVIGGEALRTILRERPDAAMAMLATLAERISRQ